jgi:hypothetical protein
MQASVCVRPLIDAHFAARISPEKERVLRGHLAECPTCRAYYERHLLVAAVDPTVPSPQERLAAGLGISPARRSARAWPLVGATAVAVALWVLFSLSRAKPSGEYAARGPAPDAPAAFYVYRVDPPERLAPHGAMLGATAELEFAYTNGAGFRHLLVFGVDEHRHVYWYYPEWTRPDTDPHGIDINAGRGLVELRQAIRHDLDGDRLTIHALFTNDDASVREVERRIADAASPDEALALAGSHEERVELTVER